MFRFRLFPDLGGGIIVFVENGAALGPVCVCLNQVPKASLADLVEEPADFGAAPAPVCQK
jgi:hypothetical protein